MSNELSKKTAQPESSRLSNKSKKFQILISRPLVNKFEFKNMKAEHIKMFHHFLEETVYKELTITQVEKAWKRDEGEAPKDMIDSEPPMIHLGKDGQLFRLFGYYNEQSYFVLCKIDSRHKTRKH